MSPPTDSIPARFVKVFIALHQVVVAHANTVALGGTEQQPPYACQVTDRLANKCQQRV
jgi:hypothetical protein